MSDAKNGENNPMYGKYGKNNPMYGKNHSEETRKNMSDAKIGENNPMFGKKKAELAGSPSQQIEVFDKKKVIKQLLMILSMQLQDALDIKQARISEYFISNRTTLYKGRYTFQKLEFFTAVYFPLVC
jgi:hypothetical protein